MPNVPRKCAIRPPENLRDIARGRSAHWCGCRPALIGQQPRGRSRRAEVPVPCRRSDPLARIRPRGHIGGRRDASRGRSSVQLDNRPYGEARRERTKFRKSRRVEFTARRPEAASDKSFFFPIPVSRCSGSLHRFFA